MASFKLDFAGFNEMRERLNRLQADTKAVCEEALVKTKELVTKKAEAAMAKPNLPAGGKYSTGDTVGSLDLTSTVTWNGTEGSIKVGFNIKKGGLPSVFLMYGTPKMPKVQALYDAFYGEETLGEIAALQKEVFDNALKVFDE